MIYQYDDLHYDPPAPIIHITIYRPGDPTKWISANALIDTGSDMTCLPNALIRVIEGKPLGLYEVGGAGEIYIGRAVSYLVEIEIGSEKKLVEVLALGDEVILGRNVLNELVLELNGPDRKLIVR